MSWLSSLFSPPTPPDPAATSAAQAAANTAAATEQQKLNMTNQITPYGNYTYSPNATSPSGYDATLALSPAQQQLLNTQQNTQQNLGGAGQELTAQLAGLYGQPPNMGSAVNNLTNQIGALGMQTPNLDPSAMTSQMMNWGQQYMQPIFNQQQSNLNAQLQNQGVTPGSEAYNNAQNLQARNVNDAYTNLFMQAEPQAFSQAVTASQVPLNQALTAQQPLYNQAMQQYQLPLQTASNILGMAGATQPTLQQTPQVQVAQPSTYATTAQNAYQGQTSMDAAALQGLFGLGGAGLNAASSYFKPAPTSSDRRLKKNIKKVGKLDNGLPVYAFEYKSGGPMQIGLMADEVETLHPEAVVQIDGFKHVYYDIATQG